MPGPLERHCGRLHVWRHRIESWASATASVERSDRFGTCQRSTSILKST
jgi:hypothetical protein